MAKQEGKEVKLLLSFVFLRVIIIGNSAPSPRSVIAVSNLTILLIHAEAMSKLQPQDRDSFFWNLKRELIFAPATFFMHPNGSNPNMVQFAKEISFDELTEGRLFEAMASQCLMGSNKVKVNLIIFEKGCLHALDDTHNLLTL